MKKKEMEKPFKRLLFIFSFIATIVYIIYRIFFTIPTSGFINIFFAIFVLIIEIVEAFFFGIYCFNILVFKKDSPDIPKVPKNKFPDIDILIATINEEESLLEETIKAVKNMKYPSKKKVHIYLCDDGRRKSMEELANKMKINYIKRKDNKDAKAGNYNNALKHTTSPYVVTFDADMQPLPEFLMKTVPFLIDDPNVGFAQTPQNFRNPDIYQCRFKLIGQIPHEQDYFFNKIQMAKNKTNSVIYCGTNTVFLRKALEEVGGFATQSVTEDIATGILIEANGYKGISLTDKMAFGIAVNNLDSYIKQKSRWCRGCLQTFKNYSVMGNKGLTLRQKLDYLSNLFYWSYGWRQIIYLFIPLLFPLFNIKMIRNNIYIFIILFFTQYIMKRFVNDIAENRENSAAWNRIYETILFPTIALDLFREIFNVGSKHFEVSPKHKEKNSMSRRNIYLLIVHSIFFFITLYALVISIMKAINLRLDYYLIPMFWLASNLIYLSYALIFDLSLKEVEDENIMDRRVENYSIKHYFILIKNFIVEEIKIPKFITFLIILILFIGGIVGLNINNTYEEPEEEVVELSLVHNNGWLSIEKDRIVNENKELVMLRGVNSHHPFEYTRLYTYDNLKELRDTWGINVFRIALFTDPNDEGYIKNKFLKEDVKKIVDTCIELDMYVIIDWHILHDNNPQTYKKEAIEFFAEMSETYSDVPNVLYEICNEPNGKEVTWDKVIKPYAEELISTIRNNSKNSIIIVGTANWSKDTLSVINNPIEEKNIIYAVHTYQGDDIYTVKDYVKLAIREKLPIIITECAATDGSGDGELYYDFFKEWVEYLETNNISWIVWQFSDRVESSSLLLSKERVMLDMYNSGKYTKEEIFNKKYTVEDLLSETGKFTKKIITKYTLKSKKK